MPHQENILHLFIDGEEVEKSKLFPDTDIKRLAEEFKKAYGLNETKDEWEMFYYKESSMNKNA